MLIGCNFQILSKIDLSHTLSIYAFKSTGKIDVVANVVKSGGFLQQEN